jgi:hypothetical protein
LLETTPAPIPLPIAIALPIPIPIPKPVQRTTRERRPANFSETLPNLLAGCISVSAGGADIPARRNGG